jgi:hypothetical protein
LTLAPDASYTLGDRRSATITIVDDDTNQAPSVDAGADQMIVLPSGAFLDATVSDDGRPGSSILTTNWSKVSGPGTVSFVDASSVDTTAIFAQTGVYVLRLTASDGAISSGDDVQIEVNPQSGADLIIASLSISNKKVAPGHVMSVSDTVKNVGAGGAGASTINFYLSTNKVLDPADAPLGGRAVLALPVSGRNSGTTSITIPSGTAPGDYYVLAVADSGGLVAEKRENNNTQYKPLTVN